MPNHHSNKSVTTNKKIKKRDEKRAVQVKKYGEYLKDHEVVGKGVYHTHTLFGGQYGKYKIEENEEFLEIYSKLVWVVELFVVERPKEVGPLIIDIDFRIPEKYDERQYNYEHIKYIVTQINSVLKTYYKLTKHKLKAFITEKKKGTYVEKDKEYKDGFHIIYPYVALPSIMRLLIIRETRDKVEKGRGLENIPFINSLKDVFDERVVKSNGFMMYGSRKQNGQYYKLTKIYKFNLTEEDITKYSSRDLPKILSNRQYEKKDMMPIKKMANRVLLDQKIGKLIEKPKKREKKSRLAKEKKRLRGSENQKAYVLKNTTKKGSLTDKEMAEELVELFSYERVDTYEDWLHIGWALHNVDYELLDCWKEWSQQCPRYDEQHCNTIWEDAADDGYRIASLHRWAKIDNPEKYLELMRANAILSLKEAETGTEYDIAKVIHMLYKYDFVCSSLSKKTWYEFQDHRWVEVENGHSLNIKISENVSREFGKLSAVYMGEYAAEAAGLKQDAKMDSARKIFKLMTQLKRTQFKKNVLAECANLFYDKKFEEKLDSNRDLIGFDNGVYDLKNMRFREGLPDDYVSFSVGYDYKEYTKDHEYVKGIENFFSTIQQEEEMREYVLTLFASYLEGHTKEEKFIIWTGSGCHEKGTKIMMHDKSVKNVEDIGIGDKLMGDDYTSRYVHNLYRGIDKLYKIEPKIGNSYTVNSEHRLALKFIGCDEIITQRKKNGCKWIVNWAEFNDRKGIVINKKIFDTYKDGINFSKRNKIFNDNYIEKNHLIVIKVNMYIKLADQVKKLLVGYRNIKNDKGEEEPEYTPITVEYAYKGEYYGFGIDKNERYLLDDMTVVMNSNGKSKSIEFFQMAFGDYCGIMPITTLTQKQAKAGNANPHLANKRGKRFVVFQEPEKHDHIFVGRMKELTGGDKVYARPLFKDPFEYKPQFKLLLTCNTLPDIPANDGGTWRRIRVTQFESEFVEVDKNGCYRGKKLKSNQFPKDGDLVEKLEKWKKALLWYLINYYYPIYKKNGLQEPDKVTAFTKKYEIESNIFLEFMDINIIKTDNKKDFEKIDDIYHLFKYWFKNSYNNKKCPDKKELTAYFHGEEYTIDKRSIYGIQINYDDDESESESD